MNQIEIGQKSQERAAKAYELRQQGLTYHQIGEHFGVKAERARHMAARGEWIARRIPDEMDGLSTRALRYLHNMGITSKAEARQTDLVWHPGASTKTLEEVKAWAHSHPPTSA